MRNVLKKEKTKEFKFYNLEFYNQESNRIQDFNYEKLFCSDSLSKFVEIKNHVFYLKESYCVKSRITGVISKIHKKAFNKDRGFIEQNFQIAESFLKINDIEHSYFVFDFSRENHLALETTNKIMNINNLIYFIESIFPQIGIDKFPLDVNRMDYLKDNILSITDISFKIKKENLVSLKIIDSSLWTLLKNVFDSLNCSEISFSSNTSSIKSSMLNHKTIETLIGFIIKNPDFVNNFDKLKICFLNKNTSTVESYDFFGKTNYSKIIDYEIGYSYSCYLNQVENKLNHYI